MVREGDVSSVGRVFAMRYGKVEEKRMLPLWKEAAQDEPFDAEGFVTILLVEGDIVLCVDELPMREGQIMRRVISPSGISGWVEIDQTSWDKTFRSVEL